LRCRNAQVDRHPWTRGGEQADAIVAFATVVIIIAKGANIARRLGQEVIPCAAEQPVGTLPTAQRVVPRAAN